MNPQTPASPENDAKRLRTAKIVIFSLVALIIIPIAGVLLHDFLNTGKLIVNTGANDNITVTKINKLSPNSSVKNPLSKSATGHISLSLPSGQYLIYVSGKLEGSSQTVNIKGRKTVTVTLSPLVISSVEPVTSFDAEDISTNSSELYYINGPGGHLYGVDSNNNITLSDLGLSLQSAQWSSTTGLGVGQDSTGRLYDINNLNTTLISTPQTISQGSQASYSVAPNGNLYFSIGKSIYSRSSSGVFKKILTAANSSPTLAGYNNKLAVIVPQRDSSQTDNDNTNLTLINANKTITKNLYLNQASWSPTGKYLAVAGSVNQILDGTTLADLQTIPVASGSVTNYTWINDSELLYGLGSGVWLYNLQTQHSQLLADVSTFGYVAEVTLNNDKSYVYVLVQNTQSEIGGYQLVRYGLGQGATVPPIMQQLQVFLPNTVNGCFIGYMNFTSPSIIATGTDSTSQNCIPVAQTYLQQYGINTAGLSFQSANQ